MTKRESNSIYWITAYLFNLDLVVGLITAVFHLFLPLEPASSIGFAVRFASSICIYIYIAVISIKRGVSIDSIILLITTLFVFFIAVLRVCKFEAIPRALWSPVSIFYMYAFPLYILARRVGDYSRLISSFKIYCYLGLVYGLISSFLLDELITDYMTFSYSLVAPVLISFVYAFVFREKKHWLITGILLLVVFTEGARGATLCVLIGCIAVVLREFRNMSMRNFILMMLGVVSAALIVVFRREIIEYLYRIFPDSRTLYILNNLNSMEMFLTGRTSVYSIAWKALQERPVLGYGVLSDRYALCLAMGYSGMVEGIYVHNILFEWLLQFGFLLGAFVILTVSVFTIRFFISQRVLTRDEQIVSLLFSAFLFTKLMISSSYVSDYHFWFVAGLLVSLRKREKAEMNRLNHLTMKTQLSK